MSEQTLEYHTPPIPQPSSRAGTWITLALTFIMPASVGAGLLLQDRTNTCILVFIIAAFCNALALLSWGKRIALPVRVLAIMRGISSI